MLPSAGKPVIQSTSALAISSTDSFVDVEDVRFSGASIGVATNDKAMQLSASKVTINAAVTAEAGVTMTTGNLHLLGTSAQSIVHSGKLAVGVTEGLSVSSVHGAVRIEDVTVSGADIEATNAIRCVPCVPCRTEVGGGGSAGRGGGGGGGGQDENRR